MSVIKSWLIGDIFNVIHADKPRIITIRNINKNTFLGTVPSPREMEQYKIILVILQVTGVLTTCNSNYFKYGILMFHVRINNLIECIRRV